MPKSDQEWREAEIEVGNRLRYFFENRRNRFSLDNPRLIEGYLAMDFGIVLILSYGEHEFCAFLERYPSAEELSGKGRDSVFLPASCPHGSCSNTRDEQTMLVHIVESMESPEHVIPTLVRLERRDFVDYVRPHSSYFSGTAGRVLLGSLEYWEGGIANVVCGICGKNQFAGQVVQRRSEVLQRISNEQGNSDGYFRDISDLKHGLSSTKIVMGLTSARLSCPVVELPKGRFKIVDVLFGPSEFGRNARNSFGHEVSILREVKGYLPESTYFTKPSPRAKSRAKPNVRRNLREGTSPGSGVRVRRPASQIRKK